MLLMYSSSATSIRVPAVRLGDPLPGADFAYGGEQYSAVRVHQGGYLTLNGSAPVEAVDCLNATAYEEDVVVALCSSRMITLVGLRRTLSVERKLMSSCCLEYRRFASVPRYNSQVMAVRRYLEWG